VRINTRIAKGALIAALLFAQVPTARTANNIKHKAPRILTQPVSQVVTAGQVATFFVSVSGATSVLYQWEKNGAAIAGATSFSYSTSATNTSDSGSQFTVTVSNSYGSATSNAASLTVNASIVAPAISIQPANQTVLASQSAIFSVAVTGTAPITYQWTKNGGSISGATASTYTTPPTTSSDNGAVFAAVVSNAGGNIISNGAILAVTAPVTLLLNPSVSNLNFGNVNVPGSSSQNVTLTNAGNSNVTISQVMVSGAGFNTGGGAAGLILSPKQTAVVGVTFAPSTSGVASGTVTVSSNATNSPAIIGLNGTGVTPIAPAVSLSWSAGATGVTGYNAYVASVSGGPYVRLTSNPITVSSYADSSVQSGHTYYYVVTELDSTNLESTYSNEVVANVP
jgi:hypothetical protein